MENKNPLIICKVQLLSYRNNSLDVCQTSIFIAETVICNGNKSCNGLNRYQTSIILVNKLGWKVLGYLLWKSDSEYENWKKRNIFDVFVSLWMGIRTSQTYRLLLILKHFSILVLEAHVGGNNIFFQMEEKNSIYFFIKK